jgi:putative membrane protein
MAHHNLKRTALAVALAFAAAGAFAKTSTLSHADRKFIEEAAAGGMLEVELGNYAAAHATSDPVKQFGQRMAADHSKANDELKSLASSKGIDLPASPDRKTQKEVAKYEKEKQARFDHEYMEHMVKDHKKDVKEFEKEAKNAKDPDLKAFAEKTLPTLQEHLRLAQSTYDTVKGSGKTTR